MENKCLYNKSNKIRSILLLAIDKELFSIKNKNTLLINSLDQWQLIDKFKGNNNYTIESVESFKGTLINEENNKKFVEIKYNFIKNKYFLNSYVLNKGKFVNANKNYKQTTNIAQYFLLNETNKKDPNKIGMKNLSNSLNKKKLEKRNGEIKSSKNQIGLIKKLKKSLM